MDSETLLASFVTIADAPSGTQRLRSLVLDLAVRGWLVEPDPSDQPAVRLLDEMADRRKAALHRFPWVGLGVIRGSAPLAS